jgi:GntR family transcriptional regulator, carbon starvation induced regulator
MTLADKAYAALRHDIIRGALPAGMPLRMADLSARYEMGFSPLREALNRLQSERLVDALALKGFTVAETSLAEMQDAVAQRILIETEALRGAIARGGDDWATGLVAALYALKLQINRADDIWELEARHHAFHRQLLVGCGSNWLMEFFERLYSATERYRIPILLESGRDQGRDLHHEHESLAEAALERNAELACSLLVAHYRRTETTILAQMAAKAAVSPAPRGPKLRDAG